MIIVGLTGGIGSGKSTVAKFFADLGVPIYDSDFEAKKLMNTDKELKKSIIGLFGEQSYKDKRLNREFIAAQVFNDSRLLEKLNRIVHPAVRYHFKNWVNSQESYYLIQETALIFENGIEDQYDKIILVIAPLETRIERVMRRDKVEENVVLSRVKNQLKDAEKISKSDFVIKNIDMEATKIQVKEIHCELLKKG